MTRITARVEGHYEATKSPWATGYVWAPGHPKADHEGRVPLPGLAIGDSLTLQLLARRFVDLSLAQVREERRREL